MSFGENTLNEALRLTLERGRFITALLEKRRSLIGDIAGLGGVAAPESFEAVKEKEDELRQVDEALGILRYGA